MRKRSLAIVFVLVLAACGGAEEEVAPVTAAATEAAPATDATPAPEAAPTEAPDATPAPSEEVDPAPSFDGPPAPDFALTLADGSSFELSAEQKPVYVVFWAEW
ncbi:MAG: hypothetical protein GY926_26925 [bacterium]|nr:hypothetical protein [bacterium]MCP4968849.1 hypothetical protein [bacterium]